MFKSEACFKHIQYILLSYILHKNNNQENYRECKMYLRIKTDGSNEGAEEDLGLRVASCLQQGPPVL